jgi:hypothetical protein
MDAQPTVKIALAIVCSLLLVLGQAMAQSVPVASTGAAVKDCGCGGKMSCCRHASQPPVATVPVSSQNQIVSSVPAVMVWVLASTKTSQISPTVSPSLSVGAAPIFARDCARLI